MRKLYPSRLSTSFGYYLVWAKNYCMDLFLASQINADHTVIFKPCFDNSGWILILIT